MPASSNQALPLADTLPDAAQRRPEPAPAPLVMSAAGATDCGKVREVNQDQYLIATLTGSLWVQQSSFVAIQPQLGDRRGSLFIVADGMGGHAGGQHASILATSAAEAHLVDSLAWLRRADAEDTPRNTSASVLQDLRAAIQHADDAVISEGRARPELTSMGTTLTIGCVIDDVLYVAHAGDSRVYLYRGGGLHQITRDHTLVGQMVEAGILSREEARHHHLRHMVTNVVGGGNAGVEADLHHVGLKAGDIVLLCSDGLTEVVQHEQIAEILMTDRDPRVATKRLIDATNAAGSPDNVTVVVAAFDVPRRAIPGEPGGGPAPSASGWFDGPRGGIIGHGMP